jgi:tripartite-type tricarboxylate transporter receptor subunit TctC
MKIQRRRFLHLAAGTAALPALSSMARAQAYPDRPVRLIVGLPPGSAPDIVARMVAQWLSQRLGKTFIVDNRPGAGTNIATEAVVRAVPDGYTLLFVTAGNAINTTFYRHLDFNFITDIAPVAPVGRTPFVMVVNPSVPAGTVPAFIAYAKANPGKINLASTGIGGANHIFAELFEMLTGVKLVHVPYRGSLFPDLLAGQVQVYFGAIPPVLAYIRTGKLRALAVNDDGSRVSVARHTAFGQIRSRLRGERLARRGRAQEHAGRYHRQAQRGNRRLRGRRRDQGAARRARRRADVDESRGIR